MKPPQADPPPISPARVQELLEAAKGADWMQVVLNYGPPCFHYEADRGRFCLRAQRWTGHVDGGEYPEHTFISLDALLLSLVSSLMQERETLRRLAKEATNGWACYARTNREHDDIARLHKEIDLVPSPPVREDRSGT